MKNTILSMIDTSCPFRGSLHWYDCTDSTNTRAKCLAKEGAPHGTLVIAGAQTQGRGRMGRQFSSPENGLYLSLILRPQCAPAQLMHLTCCTAVAACEAVEQVTGIRPGIKWINDLVYDRKKLGGILTELSIDPKTGMTEYAIIGIGINCLQVPIEVADMAVSLFQMAGRPISPAPMAAALIQALWRMDSELLTQKQQLLDIYRRDCVTLGSPVKLLGTDICATALDITDDGGLLIRHRDGTTQTVTSGEVSVRGLYGYL